MDELNPQAFTEEETMFAANREPANSVEAENERMIAELGLDAPEAPVDPNTPTPEQTIASQEGQALFPKGTKEVSRFGAPLVQAPAPAAEVAAMPAPVEGESELPTPLKIKAAIGGALSNPKQILAGAFDVQSQMVQSVADLGNSFEQWLVSKGLADDATSGLYVPLTVKATQAIQKLTADEKGQVDLGQYVANKPMSDQERNARTAGKFIAQTVALVGASAASGGAAAAVGGGVGAMSVAGSLGSAVAGFASFDPREERLSNFLNNYPATRNVVTEYLASDPGDTALEGRFKNALESILGDAALAAAFKATVNGYKMVRAAKGAYKGAGEASEAAAKVGAQNADEGVESAAKVVDGAPVEATAKEAGEQARASAGGAKGAKEATQEGMQGAKVDPTGTRMGPVRTSLKDIKASFIGGDPIPEDVQKILLKEFNLEKMDISVDSETARALGKDAEALVAAKGGVVGDAEFDARAIKRFMENGRELLNRVPGVPGAKFSPEDARATLYGMNIANKLYTQATDNAVALRKMIASGVQVDAQTKLNAAAELLATKDALGAWTDAAKGTGADMARGLRATNTDLVPLSRIEMQRMAEDSVKFNGSADDILEQAVTAQEIRIKGDVEHAKAVEKLAKKGSFKDAVQQVYLDILLSNPITHLRNVIGTTGQFVAGVFDRTFASGMGYVTKAKPVLLSNAEKIAVKEKMFPAVIGSLNETQQKAFQEAVKNQELFLSKNVTLAETGHYARGIINGLWEDALQLRFMAKEGDAILPGAEKFGRGVKTVTPEQFAKMNTVQKATHFASHFNRPTNALGAMDGFMGSIAERAQKRALAHRYATAIGKDSADVQRIFADTMANPPDFIQEQVMSYRREALMNADLQEATFGAATKEIIEGWKKFPGGKVIYPFVTVNVNMVDQAVQRSGIFSMLSPRFKDALKKGGGARDMALGKVASGLTAASYFGYQVLLGDATGAAPTDSNARKLWESDGKKEYSFKIGEKWVKMDDLGPIGLVAKMSATFTKIAAYVPEAKQEEYNDLMVSAFTGVMDSVTSDILFDSTARLSDLIRNPTDERGQRWLANTAMPTFGLGKFVKEGFSIGVPFTNIDLFTKEGRKDDQNAKSSAWGDTGSFFINAMINKFVANMPGLNGLTPQRNFFGEAIEYPAGHGPEVSSPIAFGTSKDVAVETELIRLGLEGPLYKVDQRDKNDAHLMLRKLPQTITLNNSTVQLNPKQYDTYQMLAGGDMSPLVKAKMMTEAQAKQQTKVGSLRAQMQRMITQKGWEQLPDYQKKINLNMLIKSNRERAKAMILQVHPELQVNLMQGQVARMGNALGQSDEQIESNVNEIENRMKSRNTSGGEPSL